MCKLFLLSHNLKEVANSEMFSYCLITKNGKTIPTDGSVVIQLTEIAKNNAKELSCEKVICHKDGTFTCVYQGIYVKWVK